MADNYFVISPLITRNFDKTTQKHFLTKYRLYNEYVRKNVSFNEFVQEKIEEGIIKVSELEEFLTEDLLYGNQKTVYVYDLYGEYRKNQDRQIILNKIQEKFAYVDSLKFHSILRQPLDDEVKELVTVQVETGLDGNTVQKLILIFSEKTSVYTKDGMHGEYSYITVEVDYSCKVLYLKVKPKTRIIEEMGKPSCLAEKYFEIVSKLLGLIYNPFVNVHKEALCEMNMELYNQIYNKMVQNKPNNMEKFLDTVANNIFDKLNIDNYKEKVIQNNVFNVPDMLTKMVEHILITNILYESAESGIITGVEGLVTYIKYSDGTNISARLRGETYTEPIFSSEAFMALRASINNARRISVLKISWLNEYRGSRVSYDASDANHLQIHFYKHHTKEEFDYAIKMYRKCEERILQFNPAIFAMEA